jgi:cyclophilin family peptidyl-prolyl cis-trans isomerase
MGPRIPAAPLLAALLAASCASGRPAPRAAGPGAVSPRLHHLLDLEDSRAPLRELEPFLRDADPEVRARAALAAARTAPKEAAPALRAAIQDAEPRVREAAAFAMGLTDDPDLAGDALLAAKRKGATDGERAAAASAAVRLGGERVWREEAFGALFSGGDAAVRRAAFRALPAAVRGWKERPSLSSALAAAALGEAGAGDPGTATAAAIFLRSIALPAKPEDPLPPLPEGLAGLLPGSRSSPFPDVRAACGQAGGLASAGDAGPVAAALEAEPEGRVRVALVRSLGRHRDAPSLDLLAKVLREDADFGARATAAEMIGARKEGGAPAAPALVAAAADPSRLVRTAAVAALNAVGGDAAREAVLEASRSGDAFVRAAAAGALLPIEDLARLAQDADPRVRQAAVEEAGKRKEAARGVCFEALRDLDPVVAGIACSGLAEMGAADATAEILEVLRAHPAPAEAPDGGADLRAAAIEALGKLQSAEARALAEAHLGDPDPSVVEAAAKVLEGLDGKRPVLPVPPRLLPFPDRADLAVSDAAAARVRFETDRGSFVVETNPSAAPVHCARFLARVREGGYDGTIFHRVVPAFVVQGGDPRGDGSGNGGAPTRQEFSSVPYGRGVLGVPRSTPPDSGGCQLFFCHGDTPHLDQRYTVMGRIVEGDVVLDRIDLGDRILRVSVVE